MTTRRDREERAASIAAARADLAEQGVTTAVEDAYLAGVTRGLELADQPDDVGP